MHTSPNLLLRHALVLGLLTAVGPFAIDMYLPALPAISRGLGAGARAAQASLTVFFFALGAGQLIAGPLADRWGRKRLLYAGLAVFFAGSLGCAFAPSSAALIGWRLVQGLGACAVMVIPRAVVRDLYQGADAARLMSLLMTVYSVSPILAPLAGSVVTEAVGWRGVFGVLAGLAAAGLVLVALFVRETRPAGLVKGVLAGYRVLLADRRFLGLAGIASMALGSFFVYVANSSFVLTGHYGVSPRLYALLFGLNAVSFVALSQWNGRLAARFGLARTLRAATIGHLAAVLLLLALIAGGVDRLGVLVGLLFVVYGLNGIIVPSAFVLAMEGHAAHAGSASALLGTFNFAGGAIAVAFVAPFANGTPLPMVAGTAVCSAIVAILAWPTTATE